MVLALLLALNLSAAGTPTPVPTPYYDSPPAELEVYAAYLNRIYKPSKNDGPLARRAIYIENEALDAWQRNRRAWENYLLRRVSGPGRASEECLRAFVWRQPRVLRFFNFPALKSPVKLLRSDEISRSMSGGRGWDGFYEAYPGAQGFLSFSAVTLCSGGDEALFSVRTRCGAKCEYRDVVYMQKINGRWELVQKEALP